MPAFADRGLGHVCTGAACALDHGGSERLQCIEIVVAHVTVPPTVTAESLMVGQPTPTGTDWPSLPHVQMPSEVSRSVPSMVTRRITSGPLPIRFTPLSGAVILPSSTR